MSAFYVNNNGEVFTEHQASAAGRRASEFESEQEALAFAIVRTETKVKVLEAFLSQNPSSKQAWNQLDQVRDRHSAMRSRLAGLHCGLDLPLE